jgi:hypothetical protein
MLQRKVAILITIVVVCGSLIHLYGLYCLSRTAPTTGTVMRQGQRLQQAREAASLHAALRFDVLRAALYSLDSDDRFASDEALMNDIKRHTDEFAKALSEIEASSDDTDSVASLATIRASVNGYAEPARALLDARGEQSRIFALHGALERSFHQVGVQVEGLLKAAERANQVFEGKEIATAIAYRRWMTWLLCLFPVLAAMATLLILRRPLRSVEAEGGSMKYPRVQLPRLARELSKLAALRELLDKGLEKSTLLTDTASNTQRLAFNAAIEASRTSGQTGQLSVMAAEVGNRADAGKDLAREIYEIVEQCRLSVRELCLTLDPSTNERDTTLVELDGLLGEMRQGQNSSMPAQATQGESSITSGPETDQEFIDCIVGAVSSGNGTAPAAPSVGLQGSPPPQLSHGLSIDVSAEDSARSPRKAKSRVPMHDVTVDNYFRALHNTYSEFRKD